MGVSPLTGKELKSKKFTAVNAHKLFSDHIVSIDDFKILSDHIVSIDDFKIFSDHIVSIDDFKILRTSDSDFNVKVKESILISRDEPIINKNETSLPLYLFDWSLPYKIIF